MCFYYFIRVQLGSLTSALIKHVQNNIKNMKSWTTAYVLQETGIIKSYKNVLISE